MTRVDYAALVLIIASVLQSGCSEAPSFKLLRKVEYSGSSNWYLIAPPHRARNNRLAVVPTETLFCEPYLQLDAARSELLAGEAFRPAALATLALALPMRGHRKARRTNQQAGHFATQSMIGKGGQGEVWLAYVLLEYDSAPTEPHLVVLKRMFSSLRYDEEGIVSPAMQSGLREHHFGIAAVAAVASLQDRSSCNSGLPAVACGMHHVARLFGAFKTKTIHSGGAAEELVEPYCTVAATIDGMHMTGYTAVLRSGGIETNLHAPAALEALPREVCSDSTLSERARSRGASGTGDLWLAMSYGGFSLHDLLFDRHTSSPPADGAEEDYDSAGSTSGGMAVGPSRAWLTMHRHRDGGSVLADVFRQVVLAHAAMQTHAGMLLHRDIKPRNILLSPAGEQAASYAGASGTTSSSHSSPYQRRSDGAGGSLGTMHARLADFGSAVPSDAMDLLRLYRGDPPSPQQQTLEYAPPEVRLGATTPLGFDRDAPWSYDSWSLGVSILEAVLGVPAEHLFDPDDRVFARLSARLRQRGWTDPEIDAARLMTGLSAYCIVPRVGTGTSAEAETGRDSRDREGKNDRSGSRASYSTPGDHSKRPSYRMEVARDNASKLKHMLAAASDQSGAARSTADEWQFAQLGLLEYVSNVGTALARIQPPDAADPAGARDGLPALPGPEQQESPKSTAQVVLFASKELPVGSDEDDSSDPVINQLQAIGVSKDSLAVSTAVRHGPDGAPAARDRRLDAGAGAGSKLGQGLGLPAPYNAWDRAIQYPVVALPASLLSAVASRSAAHSAAGHQDEMDAGEMDRVGDEWASADSVSCVREAGGSADASPSSRGGGRSKAGAKPRARPGGRRRGVADAVSRCEAGGSYGERLTAFRAALRRVARGVWDASGVGVGSSSPGSRPRARTSDSENQGDGEDDDEDSEPVVGLGARGEELLFGLLQFGPADRLQIDAEGRLSKHPYFQQ